MMIRNSVFAAFLATSAMALGLPPNAAAEGSEQERCCEESKQPQRTQRAQAPDASLWRDRDATARPEDSRG